MGKLLEEYNREDKIRQRRRSTNPGKTETNKYNQVKGKAGENPEISTSLINRVIHRNCAHV